MSSLAVICAVLLPQKADSLELVTVDVTILEVTGEVPAGEISAQSVGKLKKAGNVTLSSHFRLTTLNGHEAMLQTGETLAVPSGEMSSSRGGRVATTYRQAQVGTIVSVKPQAGPDDTIMLSTQIESSRIRAAEPRTSDDSDSRPGLVPPSTAICTVETTLAIRDGGSVVLRATERTRRGAGPDRNLLIVVSASSKPIR